MNSSILGKLIIKLIEDTKSNKIKWDKPTRYRSKGKEYYTNIAEIGKISIGKIKDAVAFSISGKAEAGLVSPGFAETIESNSEYYVDIMRLYILINSKRLISGNLEQSITAYINNPN